MTTDFRALCAELTATLAERIDDKGDAVSYYVHAAHLLTRARAALADGPTAVTGHPSDEELWELYQGPGTFSPIEYARAVLARWGTSNLTQTRLSPADGEVAELVAWLQETGDTIQPSHLAEHQRYKRAAELLERQVLVPVSVSERPWEREGWCDAEGRFWAEHISRSGVASWRCAAASDLGGWAVRCLPAHALPLPEVNNG